MFAGFRSFLYRHRRKFLISGIFVGGAFLLTRYARRALWEWQERETKLYLERARKQQHYESNERTCNATALTLILPMKTTIVKLLNTEEVIAELQNGATNKIVLWEKLKLMSFAKVTLLIYISSMMVVTLRLQLNLLGGYLFSDDSKDKISSNLQGRYLQINQHFLEEGAAKLCELINEKVKSVVSKHSLKEKLTVKDVEQLLWAIHSAISDDSRSPCKQLVSYILPRDCSDGLPGPEQEIYSKILTETRDLLESEEIMSLCSSCITRGLSYVLDSICEYFVQCPPSSAVGEPTPGSSTSPDSFFTANMADSMQLTDITKVTIPMAKIIPIVNGLVTSRKSTADLPHSWMQQLILMDNLKVMGANVYETFSVK